MVASKAPLQSMPGAAFSSRLSGTRKATIAITTIASGTLMMNTHRHDAVCARKPPTTGPTAPMIEANPDHVPIARPRSAPVNVTLISASDSGSASAAPMPCTERATISTITLGASAPPTDAKPKIAIPIAKNFRRPKRSPSAPPTRISAERNSE